MLIALEFILFISLLILTFIYLPYSLIRKVFNKNFCPFINIKKVLLLIAIVFIALIAVILIADNHRQHQMFDHSWRTQTIGSLSISFPYGVFEEHKLSKKLNNQNRNFKTKFYTGSSKDAISKSSADFDFILTVIDVKASPFKQWKSIEDLAKISLSVEKMSDSEFKIISGKKCFTRTKAAEDIPAYVNTFICITGDQNLMTLIISQGTKGKAEDLAKIENSITFN